jgi:tRNA (adenine57-N1/adenine58-N1)-methyltransferase
MSEYVTLLSEKVHLVVKKGAVHQTRLGPIDVRGVSAGDRLKVGGTTFVVADATFSDLLKTCRRGAQIVTPKDAGQIVAVTGVGPGWRCLDAGSGSGFLAAFLGHIVGPRGRVVSYEKREDFSAIASENIRRCGLDSVVTVKNADICSFRERNLDLVVFDLKHAHELVDRARARLKPGGWLVVYAPHIEAQIAALSEMKKHLMHVHTVVETIQRKWKSAYGYTHPEPSGVTHTGFVSFARRVL